MLKFKDFLKEEKDALGHGSDAGEGAKLKHITHPEDRPLMHGHAGFEHAHGALNQAHEHMKTGTSNSNLSMKYDGSPSIVYGHHPENGKFFVATKGAFNKNPKLNYTAKDIQANHGHAPGLVDKLNSALKHLPKVAPKKGVYQGDLMHSGGRKGDITHDAKKGTASFTPNTITYTAHGDEAKKAAASKVGVVTHTQYHGATLTSMSAHHDVNHADFKDHPDVHQKSASHDTSKVDYPKKAQDDFTSNMKAAKDIHDTHGSKMYSAIHPSHRGDTGHLASYINSTVRDKSTPSVKGFQSHLTAEHEKKAQKLKSNAGQEKHRTEGGSQVAHVEKNKAHYNNLLNMHNHMAAAKNTLVKHLETHEGGLEHHIDGKPSKPEGFVVHHTDSYGSSQPNKLVNRAEFANANLTKVRKPKEE